MDTPDQAGNDYSPTIAKLERDAVIDSLNTLQILCSCYESLSNGNRGNKPTTRALDRIEAMIEWQVDNLPLPTSATQEQPPEDEIKF